MLERGPAVAGPGLRFRWPGLRFRCLAVESVVRVVLAVRSVFEFGVIASSMISASSNPRVILNEAPLAFCLGRSSGRACTCHQS